MVLFILWAGQMINYAVFVPKFCLKTGVVRRLNGIIGAAAPFEHRRPVSQSRPSLHQSMWISASQRTEGNRSPLRHPHEEGSWLRDAETQATRWLWAKLRPEWDVFYIREATDPSETNESHGVVTASCFYKSWFETHRAQTAASWKLSWRISGLSGTGKERWLWVSRSWCEFQLCPLPWAVWPWAHVYASLSRAENKLQIPCRVSGTWWTQRVSNKCYFLLPCLTTKAQSMQWLCAYLEEATNTCNRVRRHHS